MSRSDRLGAVGFPRFPVPELVASAARLRLSGRQPRWVCPKDEFIQFLETYASIIRAPVRRGTEVLALSDSKDCRLMTLETSRGIIHTKECRGGYRAVPSSQNPSCKSRSTARDPSDARARLSQARQLPPGAVLVVGSGALGTQIAEELHRSGRKVFFAVGRFHKTPRRYRSRDFYWWFEKLGYWHTPLTSILQKRRACVSS